MRLTLEELFPKLGKHDQDKIISCLKNLLDRRTLRLSDTDNYLFNEGSQEILILEGTIRDDTARDGLKDVIDSLLSNIEE